MAKGPKRQPTARQKQATARKKDIRSKLAVLKRAGVYDGDAKRAKGNSYQARLVEKYADVIRREAAVLNVGAKDARALREQGARTTRTKVVVSKTKGERVTYNKKTKEIVGKRLREAGTRIVRRRVYFDPTHSLMRVPDAPPGKTYFYRVAYARPKKGGFSISESYENKRELARVLNQYAKARGYDAKRRKEFRDVWVSQIEVFDVEGIDQEDLPPDLEDVEDEDYGDIYR